MRFARLWGRNVHHINKGGMIMNQTPQDIAQIHTGRCQCGHAQLEHEQRTHYRDRPNSDRAGAGHGGCGVPACSCPQFTWIGWMGE